MSGPPPSLLSVTAPPGRMRLKAPRLHDDDVSRLVVVLVTLAADRARAECVERRASTVSGPALPCAARPADGEVVLPEAVTVGLPLLLFVRQPAGEHNTLVPRGPTITAVCAIYLEGALAHALKHVALRRPLCVTMK